MAVHRCAVLGGSGFVGSRLVPALANRGIEILVPSRDPERARHLRVLPGVRLLRAGPGSRTAVGQAIAGADAVINLVGILNEPGRDGRGFRRIHVELTRDLLAACEAAGIRRLIQVSALNAGAPAASSHYLRTKGEAEALIRASGLAWTILRPSVLFGPGDGFVNRFATLLRLVPVALPLAMPGTRFAPLHVDDLAAAILRTLADPSTAGQTYELCGPDIVSLREAVEQIAASLGLRRRVIGLSRGLSRLQAAIMDFVPGKPFSTDNFRSLLLDSVCTCDGCGQLGIRPRSFRVNLAGALTGTGVPTSYDRFRAAAGR